MTLPRFKCSQGWQSGVINTAIRLFTIAMVLSVGVARADTPWPKVEPSDPAAPALKEWERTTEATYQKGGLIVPVFGSWVILPFDSLKTLFPQHRFYMIRWSEKWAPGKEKAFPDSLALGLTATVVCDSTGKFINRFQHNGNYEEYGEFLHTAKMTLRTDEDAKRIWSAFCDIHRKQWQDQRAIKIDDKTWHLGDVTISDTHYFYEVLLDDEFRITSARLRSETVKTL